MIKEIMPDMVNKLIEALVTKGLVKASIKIEQDKYIFANGKLQIQLAPPEKKKAETTAAAAEKSKFETRVLANEFFNDYFKNKKIKKPGKSPWLAISTVVLAAAIVFLAIYWATARLGKNISRPRQSSNQEPQATNANITASKQDLADRNYDSLFKEATSFFAANQLDLSWQKAEMAEKIKSTLEVADLKKEIQKKRAELEAKDLAEKKAKDEIAANDISVKRYLEASEKSLQQGNLEQAFENLYKAKQVRDGPDVQRQELRLKTWKEKIDEQKKLIQKKNDEIAAKETKPAQTNGATAMVQPMIRAGRISDLNLNLAESFLSLVKRIEISDVVSDFSPSGSVTITMRIDEKGNAQVQDINDSGLSVDSESFRQLVRKSITSKLNGLQFPEPKNKFGERIRVENWRLHYKMGKYSGKIFLNRQ